MKVREGGREEGGGRGKDRGGRKGGKKRGREVRDIREEISRKGAKRWGNLRKETAEEEGEDNKSGTVGENDGTEGREEREDVTAGVISE